MCGGLTLFPDCPTCPDGPCAPLGPCGGQEEGHVSLLDWESQRTDREGSARAAYLRTVVSTLALQTRRTMKTLSRETEEDKRGEKETSDTVQRPTAALQPSVQQVALLHSVQADLNRGVNSERINWAAANVEPHHLHRDSPIKQKMKVEDPDFITITELMSLK